MKRVKINKGMIGLVYKNNVYKQVLTEGKYWLKFGESINMFDLTKKFVTNDNIDILLQDESLKNKLQIINVLDNEIVIKYNKGILEGILNTGVHIYWKSELNEFSFQKVNLTDTEEITNVDKNIISKSVFNNYVRMFDVSSYEKALLFVKGKTKRILDAGKYYFWKNETDIEIKKVDLRKTQMEVSGQEILTKDKTQIRVNFYAQYKVTNIEKAIVENKNYDKQLYVLIQLVLREYIGALTLDELLENKKDVADKVAEKISKKALDLGVQIFDAGIKDIILSGEIKDIMNKVLIAQKQAQANVITRREETASTRSLLNTAKIMEQNEMLLKLKEMEFVEKIADKIGEVRINGNTAISEQLKTIFVKS